jgi:hypothetical protein
MLREQCRIDHKMFFVFALDEDNQPSFFMGPCADKNVSPELFFDQSEFVRLQREAQLKQLGQAFKPNKISKRAVLTVVCVKRSFEPLRARYAGTRGNL